MSIATLAELFSGVKQSSQPVRAEEQLRRFARGVRILGIDECVARTWAELDTHLTRAGSKTGGLDLFTAGTVLARGLTLRTQSRKHFARIQGLKLFNI